MTTLPSGLRGLGYLFLSTLPFTATCTLPIGFPLKAYEILGVTLLAYLALWTIRNRSLVAIIRSLRGPVPILLGIYGIFFLAAVAHGILALRENAPKFEWAVGRHRLWLVGPTQAAYLVFDGAIFIATAFLLSAGGSRVWRGTLVAFVAGAVLSAGYGLYQTIGYDLLGPRLPVLPGNGVQLFDGKFARASGFFYEANFHGLYLILGLLAATWRFLFERGRTVSWAFAIMILVAALAWTYSLAASFTWSACLVLLLPISVPKWRRFAFVVGATVLAFYSAERRTVGYTTRVGGETEAFRNDEKGERNESSVRRLKYVRTELRIFQDQPLLGVGPGNAGFLYGKYDPALAHHSRRQKAISNNVYSSHLAETGLFGSLAFLGFLGSIGWAVARTFRRARSKRLRSACGFLLVAGLAYLAYLNAYPTHLLTYLWAFLGLAAAAGGMIRPSSMRMPGTTDTSKTGPGDGT
jgi:hypothetical protein